MDRLPWYRSALLRYRMHILVFLIALIVPLTFAHPAILLNDEWITTSQLSQMNEGHQVLTYEIKYGVYENGTPTEYFSARNNILGYSLLYPLISLPAEKLVVFFGNDFIFFIIYLWIFLLIGLALVLKDFFPELCRNDKCHLSSGIVIISFIGFFLNLLWYKHINISGTNSYPEIVAIVLTNILIVGFLAVIIYEILLLICNDSAYSLFGTFVCLSCSSYVFWTSFCKDHILVIFLISAIILLLIKFLANEKTGYFAGSFFITGLLIWARPELGAFVFIAMCIVCLLKILGKKRCNYKPCSLNLLIMPVFTILGAIPFFMNNYLASKNVFLPAFVLSQNVVSASTDSSVISSAIYDNSLNTVDLLLRTNEITSFSYLSSFPLDLIGIFLIPQSGGVGILPLVPVFIISILLLPLIIKKKTDLFSEREGMTLIILVLFSLAIFCAYIHRAHGLNFDLGIMPDIRYLSPMYLPLTIIGLMILRKIPGLTDQPLKLIKYMIATWIVVIPLSSLLIFRYYPDPLEWKFIFPLFNFIVTIAIFSTVVGFVSFFYFSSLKQWQTPVQKLLKILFAMACALPLVWQAGASLLSAIYAHGFEGYSFWLPILYQLFIFLM